MLIYVRGFVFAFIAFCAIASIMLLCGGSYAITQPDREIRAANAESTAAAATRTVYDAQVAADQAETDRIIAQSVADTAADYSEVSKNAITADLLVAHPEEAEKVLAMNAPPESKSNDWGWLAWALCLGWMGSSGAIVAMGLVLYGIKTGKIKLKNEVVIAGQLPAPS